MLLQGIKALLLDARAPATEFGPAAARHTQGSGDGHRQRLSDGIPNPQTLRGRISSPQERMHQILTHILELMLAKNARCTSFRNAAFFLSKAAQIYVRDDVAEPLEKGASYLSSASQMGQYSKSSFPFPPISYYDD